MNQPIGLRATLDAAGGPMSALTVLANQNDPFRVDTPAGHRDAQWLRDAITELRLAGPRHLRGLHYVLIGRTKPNGVPYTNTEQDWLWLSGTAAKSARWLGYVEFDSIVDQRNAAPEIREWRRPGKPLPYVWMDGKVELPKNLALRVGCTDFDGVQPYRLVFVGEKHSLRDVLSSVADWCKADLFLPTGEMSDTMAHTMAQAAADDGRPLVVFYFSDCDPAGWQMPISLSRKLQALSALKFPDLQWRVQRVGLTPDQVREYGLPSTPLKDTEKRADAWRTATGVAQTEIDALAALQPRLLRQIATEAVKPFFDSTLDNRVLTAYWQWQSEAQSVVDGLTDEQFEWHRTEVEQRLDEIRTEVSDLLESVKLDADNLDLPDRVVPDAELGGEQPTPLCDSEWSFTEQCHRLIASKRYDEFGATA